MPNETSGADFNTNMKKLEDTQKKAQTEFFELTIRNTKNKTEEAVASSNVK